MTCSCLNSSSPDARRYVTELGEVVFKKTAGHAIFVVQLLNSLLRDSIVTYSMELYRYRWDVDVVDLMQLGSNVAELISSNLKNMPEELLNVLHILSLFGTQTEVALLDILEGFQPGIASSIDNFIEQGILDRAGGIVMFTVRLCMMWSAKNLNCISVLLSLLCSSSEA